LRYEARVGGRAGLEIILDNIVRALRRGEAVELRRFGSFHIRERRARTGRNPKTGIVVNLPAKKIAFFRPAAEVLRHLNAESKASERS
jgi:integration host factor subunit beta